MSDSLEWLSKDKNLIIIVLGIFLVVIVFFGTIKTWGTITDDYFVPKEGLVPGRLTEGWNPSSDVETLECKKTKRVYGYSWTPSPMIAGPCGGGILEFNTTDEATLCFDSIVKSYRNRNETEEYITVGSQYIKSFSNESFKWAKNRFVFSLGYGSSECAIYRDNIIKDIISKYPLF